MPPKEIIPRLSRIVPMPYRPAPVPALPLPAPVLPAPVLPAPVLPVPVVPPQVSPAPGPAAEWASYICYAYATPAAMLLDDMHMDGMIWMFSTPAQTFTEYDVRSAKSPSNINKRTRPGGCQTAEIYRSLSPGAREIAYQ